jgi:UDP-N-acetylmuramoyl-tripeptide--D-alanyl-D-alanine ligase
MAGRTTASVVTYGLEGGDVVAERIVLDDELHPSFVLRSPWGEVPVTLAVRGHHQVANALAAVAAAVAAGADLDAAVAGVERAQPSRWRMELHRTNSGALVLNDAYNANPISMTAALRSLAAMGARRRIAVLGTMAELGAVADAEHRAIAELARDLDVHLIAVAEPRYGAELVDDIDAAVEALGRLGEGDAVLVKGSRVAGLERVADALLRNG